MREIKFRVWDTLEKKWIDKEWIKSGDGGNDWIAFRNETVENQSQIVFDNPYPRERIKLVQYTGLKDKNGTEIYEGDILQLHLNTKYGMVERKGRVICEHLGSCYAEFIDTKFYTGEGVVLPTLNGNVKVIGNIHVDSEP